MPPDYYGGEGDEGAAAAAPEAPPAEAKTEGKTDILPISFFPDPPKPGDVCKLDVLKVHDDSVEVRYHPEGDGDEDENDEGGELQEASMPPGRMDSMMEA